MTLEKVDVIVPAAGTGSRMGTSIPKQYLDLCGSTILEYTVAKLLSCACVNNVIVAVSPGDRFFKSCVFAEPSRIKTAAGGRERCDSVRAALDLATTSWVMVHDAARPLVQKEDVETLALTCIGQNKGGLLVSPVADTLKRAVNGVVSETVLRADLYRAQTPQMFKTKELIHAMDQANERGLLVTDEASAMELTGYKPLVVISKGSNFKITSPADLELARALVKSNKGALMRIGHGFDVHRFGGEGPCILGGVQIPYEKGLIAHSDGDVVLHALCDALLGALALGDIGRLYPDTDEAYRGADSRVLLRDTAARVKDRGYCPVNVDITILAQEPKISPYSQMMRENIADDLGIDPDRVSIKATTTEKLGFTGRKEGIAVEAAALLERI